ncbi:DUF4328 domain-containing protein [Streptodolium elevatio]
MHSGPPPGAQPGGYPGARPGPYGGVPHAGFPQPGMPPAGMPPGGMPPGGAWQGGVPGYAPPMQWTPVQPLRGLATAVSILLGVVAAIDVLSAIAFFRRASLFGDLRDGRLFAFSEADDADDLVEASLGLLGFGALATAIVFMIWFHRARSNTEAWYAPQATMSKGWAIGGWFIPLANYVIPMIVANDTWKRSDPQPAGPMGRPAGKALLWAWWIVFGLSGILFSISFGVRETKEDVEDGEVSYLDYIDGGETGDNLAGVSSLLRIAAAVLAILVVQKITKWQSQRLGLEPVGPIAYAPGMPPGGPGFPAPQPGGLYPGSHPGSQPGHYPGSQPGAQPGWGGQQPPPAPPTQGPDLHKH